MLLARLAPRCRVRPVPAPRCLPALHARVAPALFARLALPQVSVYLARRRPACPGRRCPPARSAQVRPRPAAPALLRPAVRRLQRHPARPRPACSPARRLLPRLRKRRKARLELAFPLDAGYEPRVELRYPFFSQSLQFRVGVDRVLDELAHVHTHAGRRERL